MEGIVSDALVNHMKTNEFITNKQCGFLKERSATLQLLNVLDEWTKLYTILDAGISIDVLDTDFQKAFDTVSHRRLFAKLTSYGFSGKILTWIQSFLTDRKQRVVVMPGDKKIVMGMDCGWRPPGKRDWAYFVFDLYKLLWTI